MEDPADSPRIRAAQEGSPTAIEQLYERSAPKLLAYIRLRMGRSLRSRLESRDILQAAMLKSFERLDEFRGTHTGSLMAWLAKIAEREIADRADFYRRQRRDAAREEPLEEGREVPAAVRSALSQAIADERTEQLEEAIESLSDAHREIILLRKFEELSFPEIAARLGKSEDACRMLLARAMTALTIRLASRERP
ncbi:MAG TPA: sigma-70 family RNA polymerase sigma factor [Vicinamibacterales bacterium]|nr:sigma-70 family RNA polymerase sigma factor [Vicinamibacterales bacterium]